VEDTVEDLKAAASGIGDDMEEDTVAALTGAAPEVKPKADPAAVIYEIPELASLGRVFRSSAPVPLTENETEYVVQCIKHIFAEHVVLQFTVQNTIDDQRLENVTVAVDGNDSELFEVSGEIAAEKIPYGETVNCFTVLDRNAEASLGPNSFSCELHFTVVQVDPATGEDEGDSFEEEYPLEDLEIATADFMGKVAVGDFRKAWETMGNANEVLEKFALQFKNLNDAVAAVIDFLGMQPCDGTASVNPNATDGKPHMLHMSGVFVGGCSVLARAQVALQSGSVVLKIAVRSEDETVSRMVADCIR
jgi:coatomer protein complex subunit gamma